MLIMKEKLYALEVAKTEKEGMDKFYISHPQVKKKDILEIKPGHNQQTNKDYFKIYYTVKVDTQEMN